VIATQQVKTKQQQETAMTAAHISEPARWRGRDSAQTIAHRRGRLAALLDLVRTWYRRSRERQALAALSDLELRDIGTNRGDALTEASKPFWRA
jgi:uncharacterized protein YjiS (DUF1127 family)